jgi:hypothetical protein
MLRLSAKLRASGFLLRSRCGNTASIPTNWLRRMRVAAHQCREPRPSLADELDS